MLTPLDDTLWHQLPTTFDHVWTSDPRFFDRYWFAIYSGDGRVAIQVTMGAYRNMNVLDTGVVMVVDGKQYNLRASRSLNGSVETVCGPVRIRPIEPLKSFEIIIEPGEHGWQGNLRWDCVEPAREEHPHYNRLHGRTVEDYRRFDQIGVASGFLQSGSQRVEIGNWWSCRDHSWGHVMSFLFFSTDALSGHLLFQGRGDDTPYTTGVVTDRHTGAFEHASNIALEVELHEGTRRFRRCSVAATLDDGRVLRIAVQARGSAIAMQGLGYSGGYNDGQGLGAWRGENHLETDVWDVSHPSKIVYPDGSHKEHWHRIQPVSIDAVLEGKTSTGTASMTLTIAGRLPEHLRLKAPGQ
ncbi:MAG: hypothetical protein LW719_04395 [Comamonadaceae bacterium]|nr:hypothetical protein [Comamonadaceae bacterium]